MVQARVLTINIGQREPNPHGKMESTGIHKRPIDAPVHISAPGATGSGLAGDYIGDPKHHGGDDQAVYVFAREDLDRWERIKSREFPSGACGENLTTVGIDVNEALIGERWRIGDDLVLEVTSPRIPCTTFRGVISEPKWIKEFIADARPGTYFKVIEPGTIAAGDPIEVVYRPPHDVTISLVFRATTTDRSLNTRLQAAAEYLPPDLVQYAATAVVDKDPE